MPLVSMGNCLEDHYHYCCHHHHHHHRRQRFQSHTIMKNDPMDKDDLVYDFGQFHCLVGIASNY